MATTKKKTAHVTVFTDDANPGTGQLVEFRKANDSIGLRVVEGRFSLLSRKLFNVFLSKAQEQQRPGVDAPVDDAAAESYFWMPIKQVVTDTDYNSGDYETLKEHAQELQNIKVANETNKMWTSERLLSGVKIYNSKGLRNKNGTVWLGFSFPPEVLQMVLKPSQYTKLSLYYQTLLRSAHSLSLYEVARRYATSPSHLTNRDRWERWFYVISGTPIGETNLPEYKYFKRDTMMKAITEINAVTDIEVEVLEFREGRKVAEIQFRVNMKAQAAFELPSTPIINSAVVSRITAFGVSKEDAETIYASYEESVVLAHVELVESRLRSGRGAAVESAAAYFRTAIKKGFANGRVIERTEAKPPTEGQKKKKDLRARFMAARNKDALEYYEELSPSEQQVLYTTFSKGADPSLKPYLKKKLEMTLVKTAFGDWLATDLWGVPTDSQILDFLETGGDE
jgi:hypothetical protein